jgi:hypothetical protein
MRAIVDIPLINMLTVAEDRLPKLKSWLMDSIWTQKRYEQLGALKYLKEGETEVNEMEKLIAATADRIYREFFQEHELSKNILTQLTTPSTAVIVFDGMSVRELPILIQFAQKSGMKIIEHDYAFSAIPSETMTFVEHKLGCIGVSPSQLPGRKELREKGIHAVFLSSNTQCLNADVDAQSLLVWSSFPDNTYSDSNARFEQHFEHICHQIETAWIHSVQQIKRHKRIIITSDHGYVFFGSGMDFGRLPNELRELNSFFGNDRNKFVEEGLTVPVSDDVFYDSRSRYAMVKGRVHTRSTGQAAARLYKHGGLSLMECFVPWLVLERK